MYTIDFNKRNTNQILLYSKNKENELRINTAQGARIESLKLHGKSIIKEIPNFNYQDSYASAFLFPFVSRVKDGFFKFENNQHQLKCNKNGHALHGFLQNKTFQVQNHNTSTDKASISLSCAVKEEIGFSFSFHVLVTYMLTETGLKVQVIVKNTSSKTFPYTIGWHPYFYSNNLQESSIAFTSNKQVVFDENLITKSLKEKQQNGEFQLKNVKLDDCFLLKENNVSIHTPNYSIDLISSIKPCFLQLFTPKNPSFIAVELQSGVSNSLNNGIGLEELNSNEEVKHFWKIKMKSQS